MSRTDPVQFNVRSAFARSRAHDLAQRTGMTVTQVVEEALRGYVPPGAAIKVGRLAQRGLILVLPAKESSISLAEANAALNEVRERDLED
ncbi:MAG TPA: hypothetical protein VNT30_24000 [Stellaceae bacterium]|nr:hypothetical protein [Stellaceae bacterium]